MTILFLIFDLFKLVNDIADEALGLVSNILLLETYIIRRIANLEIDYKLVAIYVPRLFVEDQIKLFAARYQIGLD